MMLPIIGAVLFMLGSMGGPISIGTFLAAMTFLLLAGGLVVGTLRLSKSWEDEGPSEQH